MELFNAIIKRRSIRNYIAKPVSPEFTEKILKAAMYAPTANNYLPFQFIVITERNILNEIPNIQPYSKMLYMAPLAILVCGDDEYEKNIGYHVQNCSASTQNILLSATALGLATCWIGIYPREERMNGIKKLLKLPVNVTPISLVAIGYTDETVETPDRFISSRIHYNGW
jgi:nitroreductase